MTHHIFTEQFIHSRQADLRAAAARRRVRSPQEHKPRTRTPKERFGWFLVETGLRLTAPSPAR
ncbi:hypothetical protein OG943_46775 [Amycolatopsis sp. NBC_00345]|uniref:hypothetical protein n=1 Tax=Amycolatopsis sp. NBC_00345 TaxID=2975955 RepID=UPI002E270ECB